MVIIKFYAIDLELLSNVNRFEKKTYHKKNQHIKVKQIKTLKAIIKVKRRSTMVI